MSGYLNMIDHPSDLKKLHPNQLEQLAEEIREKIVRTVSRTGGHLSSSLGSVELAIAVHHTFNAPHDKIVWDVGHQAYAHKLITGRRDSFKTLRQLNGLSGFLRPSESEFDTFGAGHAGTSISAAMGMAAARDLRGTDERVVAILGDGALTNGMAFEALNNCSCIKNLIVILNDNEMSISENVGAISAYLNRIITMPLYNKILSDIDGILKKIPGGTRMIRARQRLAESVKSLLVPGVLFEEMGFRYYGPVNGNSIQELLHMLRTMKDPEHPMLLHVVTRKGKGYKPAEENPEAFHSTDPFEISTGNPLNHHDKPTYTEVFSDTIISLAENDPRICAITAAMAKGTGLDKFRERFPERFYDVGIAEGHAVTFAGGLAVSGFRPVVTIYSTFLQRGFDQVLHDVALQKLPVIFAMDRSGLVGADGPTHHGIFDISYLGCIPNMTILSPKDERELRDMLHFAAKYDGPIALRYPRGETRGVSLDKPVEEIRLGEGRVERDGDTIAIFAVGTMVYEALRAADILVQQGLNPMVINPRFIKPLDNQLIRYAASKTRCFVSIEEQVLFGGFGSLLSFALEELRLSDITLRRLGISDVFVEHGSTCELKQILKLTPEDIARECLQIISSPETIHK